MRSGWPRSLSLRLASMFALAGVLLLGAIGFYLYGALQREIAWRDDQALLGRLERMRALLDDSRGIEALRSRPQLYENMLGNRDSLLWVLDDAGRVLIEINPPGLPLPRLPRDGRTHLGDIGGAAPARLAWSGPRGDGRGPTLIAGKLLAERTQMLAAYRLKLWLALLVGGVLVFLLGWAVSQRGLRPVRQLAARAAAVDARHLHLRLDGPGTLSELQALSQALDRMLARLEDGFAQLSRFSADLAHELRTPLANLMGHTQLALRRPRRAAEYQELLASNQEEYERLARMIDSMLFLARAEQPGAAVAREPIGLHAAVEQVCEYFEGMAEERGVQLLNRAEGELTADPGLLRRALANLLANALHHGAALQPVTIATGQRGEWTELSVHNRGEAIAAEHLPRVFDRFYRIDAARARHGDSGGLGLAIVRSIMQLHGGKVEVDSNPAAGTRFTLCFPR